MLENLKERRQYAPRGATREVVVQQGATVSNRKTELLEEITNALKRFSVEQLAAVREFILDQEDEAEWDAQFATSHDVLIQMSKRAKQQVAEGKVYLLDEE